MFYGPDFVDIDALGKVIKKEKRQKPDYGLRAMGSGSR
jgi:hypothetical protein